MRILVIRTDRIGDLVLALPVAQLLKDQISDSYVTYLVSPYTKDILLNNPFIDSSLVFKSFHNLLRVLKQLKFDVAINLYSCLRIAILITLAKIPQRVANEEHLFNLLFYNHIIPQRRRLAKMSELDYNLELVSRALSIKPKRIPAKIYLTEKEKEWGLTYCQRSLNIGEDFIIIHPGSWNSAPRWPLPLYAELINELAKEYKILITYGAQEEALITSLKRSINRKVYFLIPQPLRRFISIISHAKLLISNSTGPLHLASACNVPTIGLYSPLLSCYKRRWMPQGAPAIALSPREYPCRRCSLFCQDYPCMQKIIPQRVKSVALQILSCNLARSSSVSTLIVSLSVITTFIL